MKQDSPNEVKFKLEIWIHANNCGVAHGCIRLALDLLGSVIDVLGYKVLGAFIIPLPLDATPPKGDTDLIVGEEG